MKRTDVILFDQAPTLAGAFRERVKRTPDAVAYIQYQESSGEDWCRYTWRETAREVGRWQKALRGEELAPGDRVAVMLRNCREWVIFDQAAQALGLVTVPLYTNDRPENIGYILQDSGVRLLLLEDATELLCCAALQAQLNGLRRIVSLKQPDAAVAAQNLAVLDNWLPSDPEEERQPLQIDTDSLATVIYTSGTTGRPKGVMLSHRNILQNAIGCLRMIDIFPDDLMLSFLPLSHSLERNLGYYLPILAGSQVAYARSVPQLAEDLLQIRPTILIAVPRIFERIYHRINQKLRQDNPLVRALFKKTTAVGWQRFEHQQKRAAWSPELVLWPLLETLVAGKIQARLGGRLRFAVSGGAALAPDIARFFIGLGVPIQQGYGLTETSPVISANPLQDNLPASVGCPLSGIEVKIGDNDELYTRSSSVMLGYWNDPEGTRKVLSDDGWLRTGDQARIENGHIYITGRLKEIIVLSNGEKVSPADMELAIAMDDLCDQVLVVGEGRPYLVALLVPKADQFADFARGLGLDPDSEDILTEPALEHALLERIHTLLHAFPGYAKIHRVAVVLEPWAIETGLMTPTMKLRRNRIIDNYQPLLDRLYESRKSRRIPMT